MTYFQNLRDQWIIETIQIFGFIQRGHLCRKFDISPQQATKDLSRVQKLYPSLMRYDLQLKAYRYTATDFPTVSVVRLDA